MSEGKLPKLFRAVLDAQDAAMAVDYKKHPRIHQRRWAAWQQARAALRQEYPRLEDWLFPYTVARESSRDELLRLIAAAQKEASDDDAT